MIDFNRDEPPQPAPSGGLGGLIAQARGIRDTRLIERALRQKWPVPAKHRKALVERQVAIALDPESSPRESTSAFRALVAAEHENTEVALKALDKLVPDQHEMTHFAEEMKAELAEARRDASYVELERKRLAGNGAHAGPHGSNGKSGPLANGSAPGVG